MRGAMPARRCTAWKSIDRFRVVGPSLGERGDICLKRSNHLFGEIESRRKLTESSATTKSPSLGNSLNQNSSAKSGCVCRNSEASRIVGPDEHMNWEFGGAT